MIHQNASTKRERYLHESVVEVLGRLSSILEGHFRIEERVRNLSDELCRVTRASVITTFLTKNQNSDRLIFSFDISADDLVFVSGKWKIPGTIRTNC